jgi:hypothetical protein
MEGNIKEKFILSKCKTKAAYSARLKSPTKLNLDKIKTRYKTVMETKILLVLKIDNIEIICHNYGELLFKNCDDMNKMEKIAVEIYSLGL